MVERCYTYAYRVWEKLNPTNNPQNFPYHQLNTFPQIYILSHGFTETNMEIH